jgi:hypothetical protein
MSALRSSSLKFEVRLELLSLKVDTYVNKHDLLFKQNLYCMRARGGAAQSPQCWWVPVVTVSHRAMSRGIQICSNISTYRLWNRD